MTTIIAEPVPTPFPTPYLLNSLAMSWSSSKVPRVPGLAEGGEAVAGGAEQAKGEQIKGLAEIIIGKQRHGPTGTEKLYFNSELVSFSNLSSRRGDDGDELDLV